MRRSREDRLDQIASSRGIAHARIQDLLRICQLCAQSADRAILLQNFLLQQRQLTLRRIPIHRHVVKLRVEPLNLALSVVACDIGVRSCPAATRCMHTFDLDPAQGRFVRAIQVAEKQFKFECVARRWKVHKRLRRNLGCRFKSRVRQPRTLPVNSPSGQ